MGLKIKLFVNYMDENTKYRIEQLESKVIFLEKYLDELVKQVFKK